MWIEEAKCYESLNLSFSCSMWQLAGSCLNNIIAFTYLSLSLYLSHFNLLFLLISLHLIAFLFFFHFLYTLSFTIFIFVFIYICFLFFLYFFLFFIFPYLKKKFSAILVYMSGKGCLLLWLCDGVERMSEKCLWCPVIKLYIMVRFQFWRVWSTPSLLLPPGPL